MVTFKFQCAALLLLALSACSTTSTVRQPLPQGADRVHALAYSFENAAGDDQDAVAKLDRIIQARLLRAGLVAAAGAAPEGRIEVELTHFHVRSNAARFLAGILAGRDKIASTVTVFGEDGTQLGSFEVETTNLSAWGSTEGLMEQHGEEIAARLQPTR